MNIKIIFRSLLIASVLLPIIGAVSTELTISSQSTELQQLIAWDGYDGLFWLHPQSEEITTAFLIIAGIGTALFILCIIGLIGIFLFKKWGRTITVLMTLVATISQPFMGVLVVMPIASTLYGVSTMAFGALLCMAYLQPISSEFNK